MVISPALILAGCAVSGLRFALREKWAVGLTHCSPFWVSPLRPVARLQRAEAAQRTHQNMFSAPSACQPRSLLEAVTTCVQLPECIAPAIAPSPHIQETRFYSTARSLFGPHLVSELHMLFPNRTPEGSRINIVFSSG